jgi:protein-S-isoprenylcysteine O-methyltransferase Ste14
VTPLQAIGIVWAAWLVSWIGASLWSSRTEARPRLGSQLLYEALTRIGAVVLFVPALKAGKMLQLWRTDEAVGWLLALAALVGVVFTWWARAHLGRLWSSTVTRKADHRVVDTGPYRLVRHPIYTGIIFATFATMIAEGTAFAVVGAALMVAGWYVKARLEERFLRTELGASAYDDYARRVPMLLPFVHLRR